MVSPMPLSMMLGMDHDLLQGDVRNHSNPIISHEGEGSSALVVDLIWPRILSTYLDHLNLYKHPYIRSFVRYLNARLMGHSEGLWLALSVFWICFCSMDCSLE